MPTSPAPSPLRIDAGLAYLADANFLIALYFAAFARAGGHRLLTFDRGFRQFDGLDVEILGW
jgi:predicted nucleic acid-binding protein